jgi:DNA-binding helix-hairpin-helix protein with protein kinase domain
MQVQTRTKPALFDLAGRPLHLGSQLGSGGEGAVYQINDQPNLVVKLYYKKLDSNKAVKIVAMTNIKIERLLLLGHLNLSAMSPDRLLVS